jgi:hypothetical protein
MATINGVVRESDGEVVPMATVFDSDSSGTYVQGGSTATTDFDGRYSISPKGNFITFKMVGFTPFTTTANNLSQTPNVILKDSTTLKPVEVVAERIVVPTTPVKEKKKFKIKPIHVAAGIGIIGLVVGSVIFFSKKSN